MSGGSLFRPVLVASLVVAFALAAAGSAGAQGNADAAQACQRGGWQELVKEDGTPFANAGECVNHAAQGELLYVCVAFIGFEGENNEVSGWLKYAPDDLWEAAVVDDEPNTPEGLSFDDAVNSSLHSDADCTSAGTDHVTVTAENIVYGFGWCLALDPRPSPLAIHIVDEGVFTCFATFFGDPD